jgi:hypothetical protein
MCACNMYACVHGSVCRSITHITNKFNLGQDVLHANDVTMYLECSVLRMGDEEVSLWCPRT